MVRTLISLCVLSASVTAQAAERPRPLIVAHRGLLRHGPENTLANFRACLELRLGFEFDVQRTKDGQLVCVHDDTLNRTTNGTGKVSDRTLKEIRQLDAGGWFDPRFAGEKVPTIAEVLELLAEYRRHDILAAVDLKVPGAEREIVALAEKHKILHRLLFIGKTIAEPAVRKELRGASAKAPVAVVANQADEFPQALADAGANWVYVRFLPSREQVETARRAGKQVFIAGPTVSGHLPANWRHAAAVGIDAILTDYPLELRTGLRKE